MAIVATTIPNGAILQLFLAPELYAPLPAYQSVTIPPAQRGVEVLVDDNFWAAWLAENAANPLVINNMIFAV